mgnify:FL=1
MDFQELKDIIQRDGGKVIIVENDKPQFVVMSFEEYRTKIQIGKRSAESPKGIQADPPPATTSSDVGGGGEMEGLTIDDLPLS